MKQQQVLQQSQTLNTFLLQQKLQILHLMHLPALAVEDYIKDELQENPALEENFDESQDYADASVDASDGSDSEVNKLNEIAEYFEDDEMPDYKTQVNNYSKGESLNVFPIAYNLSFQEQLKEQMKEYDLNSEMRSIVEYLIDSLDEDGYLRTPLADLSDNYSFARKIFVDEPRLDKALNILQKFDPPGVGARSLQECLLLQLKAKDGSGVHDEKLVLAENLIENYFTELHHKNYEKILRNLDIDQDHLKEAIKSISVLSPRPVFTAAKDSSEAQAIIPDFVVTCDDNLLEIALTSFPSATIKVNDEYTKALVKAKNNERQKTYLNYFRKKIGEAKWLIEALQQREQTLMKVMKTIASIQKEYFITGDRKDLKPMVLKDVAEISGFDLSTISRVTCNKYAQTPHGNILLKDLFSTSLPTTEGGLASTSMIKEVILDIVKREDKSRPYTDIEMVNVLKERGFKIARRTIVKYREKLHLPNAQGRKELV